MYNLKLYTPLFIAPIEAASFCGAKRNKRYSGKRETAPEKRKLFVLQNNSHKIT